MGREVVVLDRRDWEILDRFESVRDVAAFYDMSISRVYSACVHKTMMQGEYICFRWADDCALEDENFSQKDGTPVVCTFNNQEYKFPDTFTAAKFCDVPSRKLTYALQEQKWTKNGICVERMKVAR